MVRLLLLPPPCTSFFCSPGSISPVEEEVLVRCQGVDEVRGETGRWRAEAVVLAHDILSERAHGRT